MIVLGEKSDGFEAFWKASGDGFDAIDAHVDSSLDTWLPVTRPILGGVYRFEARIRVPSKRIRDWAAVYWVDSTGRSQFDVLVDLLRGGFRPAGPVACFAGTGTGFHGQRGRGWSALRGNIHLSLILPVDRPTREVGVAMTVLPALAAADVVRSRIRPDVSWGFKWVNDIWVERSKLCGVLTQSICTGGRMEYAVLGIGLNVFESPALRPTPFLPGATTLADWMVEECGPGCEAELLGRLSWALLDAVEERMAQLCSAGPEGMIRDYRDASILIGHRVCVFSEPAEETPEGRGSLVASGGLRNIGSGLELALEGVQEPITKGRVAYEEDCLRMGWMPDEGRSFMGSKSQNSF